MLPRQGIRPDGGYSSMHPISNEGSLIQPAHIDPKDLESSITVIIREIIIPDEMIRGGIGCELGRTQLLQTIERA